MVQKGLADQAFKREATQMLSDGRGVTAERAAKLQVGRCSLTL